MEAIPEHLSTRKVTAYSGIAHLKGGFTYSGLNNYRIWSGFNLIFLRFLPFRLLLSLFPLGLHIFSPRENRLQLML